jgi:hypothetical protein
MLKFFNILAVAALIGSASWAYTVKYDTIFYVEQIKKIESQINKERDAVAILKADWQHLTKPVRLQVLTDKHLSLQPLAAIQIIRSHELPERKASLDAIAEKMGNLGIVTGSTPNQGLKTSGRTPEKSMTVKASPVKSVSAKNTSTKNVSERNGGKQR